MVQSRATTTRRALGDDAETLPRVHTLITRADGRKTETEQNERLLSPPPLRGKRKKPAGRKGFFFQRRRVRRGRVPAGDRRRRGTWSTRRYHGRDEGRKEKDQQTFRLALTGVAGRSDGLSTRSCRTDGVFT